MEALSASLVWSRDARYADECLFSYNGLNENLLKLTDMATNVACMELDCISDSSLDDCYGQDKKARSGCLDVV
jgi:hypothetical protein